MTNEKSYRIAHAAGWDAGNRSMKAAGRTIWNVDDYNASARTMNMMLDASEQERSTDRLLSMYRAFGVRPR